MKRLVSYALVSALLTAPAFAAKNSQSFKLPVAVNVGSTQLSAGDYKVSWTETGPNAKVTLEQYGKAPVTVAAKVTDEKHGRVSYTVNRIGGVDQLETIQLDKVNVVLDNATSSGQ